VTSLIAAEGGWQDFTLQGGEWAVLWLSAAAAILALGVGFFLVKKVMAEDEGSPRMREIAGAIQEGAWAYLKRQFKTIAVILVPLAVIVFVTSTAIDKTSGESALSFAESGLWRTLAFILGCVASGLTGYIGMTLATRGNVRTAAAALSGSMPRALTVAFRTGGIAGMFTVGLGLLGATLIIMAFQNTSSVILVGFGFGGSLLALFLRVGGGIFTKAADVGADLVGKVEAGIPEDDPRNPATIADNVGDNVGDCAGMAADLFESYAVVLVAALILGSAAFGELGLVLPLIIPAIGVITAVIGIFTVSPRATDRSGMSSINRGFFISAVISAILVVVATFVWVPSNWSDIESLGGIAASAAGDAINPQWFVIGSVFIGIVLAAVIQQLTAYFTETNRRPVDDVAKTSLTGPATVILSGISLGLESAVYTALVIGAAVYGAFLLGSGTILLSLFAIALAGTGLLTTVGVIVSMDTFGPVSDNAQGIAEMSGDVEGEGAAVLTRLDAVGNSTKAITKGIAIATAVLAATALFGAYREAVFGAAVETSATLNTTIGDIADQIQYYGVLDVANPANLVGLVIGAAVVFLFSGLAINAVSRAAGAVIFEVRRQFREIPGIMEGTAKPEYGKVVDIVTRDSLRELVTPGLLAVLTPIAVGFGLGVGALGAYLAGTIATGVLMAVFLSNSGGAWDNAKKFVEDGHFGGKNSEAHSATVIGDTVGDPFKDTAGPAINPLIKVMNLVALLVAPAVVTLSIGDGANPTIRWAIAIVAAAIVVVAVVISKRRPIAVGDQESAHA
jgi:K(+)-stimulated pyrophosphate-energized sodium pump